MGRPRSLTSTNPLADAPRNRLVSARGSGEFKKGQMFVIGLSTAPGHGVLKQSFRFRRRAFRQNKINLV